ncbi:FkbM family methyltransferase [Chelatococcus caeni]|uniref:FkbM family methyltransferase n=1 Tax=Chelatococcus caeni TaxID=1348468 RepID=A0A840C0F4_9HYPH|nr:FkbM family methyltransferase [Chelatococcus caeni]
MKVTTGRSVVLGDRRIALADDQPTFWERVAADNWEPGTRRLIDTLVDASTLFVDLGAWVGPTTLQAAARGARVVAVEADPAALDQLGRNLAVNPELAARVTVVPKAIHPDGGTVTFGARRKPGDSMSSLLLAGADTTWQAEALTPAALAERLPPSPRRVIKIDLEGAEYALLPAIAPPRGARERRRHRLLPPPRARGERRNRRCRRNAPGARRLRRLARPQGDGGRRRDRGTGCRRHRRRGARRVAPRQIVTVRISPIVSRRSAIQTAMVSLRPRTGT